MIRSWLNALFAKLEPTRGATSQRERLVWPGQPAIIYAIGDVHGQLDMLKQLEERCIVDAGNTAGEKIIILLGDLIDRGPHSAQVIDRVMSRLPDGWVRLAIAGNHEASFSDALTDPRRFETWLGFGGLETLGSYGIGHREIQYALGKKDRIKALFDAALPPEHVAFILNLPVSIAIGPYTFVHAGGRPGIADDEQDDRDLMWYKGERTNIRNDARVVVHGHEIVEYPDIQPSRINVDTGAYSSGILSAVRLSPGSAPHILQSQG